MASKKKRTLVREKQIKTREKKTGRKTERRRRNNTNRVRSGPDNRSSGIFTFTLAARVKGARAAVAAATVLVVGRARRTPRVIHARRAR